MVFYQIYFSFLSLFILGWLYIWNTKLDLRILIPAITTLLFYLFQYKKYGRDYILDLINSNIFMSLFFLSWPCIYIMVVINSRQLNFYEKLASSFVVSSVSIFIFSAIWGFFITLFPKQETENQKSTIKIKIIIFVLSYWVFCIYPVYLFCLNFKSLTGRRFHG